MKNLLLQNFDRVTDLFIEGIISYQDYEFVENKFNKYSKLFTVCLN